MMTGMLLIDKPIGISSFGVIRQLRGITGIKKIGHAGTLDPLATGLLIILIGGATKQADRFLKLDKSYEAELTLGASSATDDAEGPIVKVSTRQPTKAEITEAIKQFVGKIEQVPPAHSAIKIGGQRAYRLARKGQMLNLGKRQVEVYQIKLLAYRYPVLKIALDVSSGTYIRSLARDLGQALGTGAYMSGLKRTKITNFDIDQALSLQGLTLGQVKNALQVVESL